MAENGSELRPLDEEFVDRLIAVAGVPNLSIPRRENHFWRDQLKALRKDFNNAQIAELIAENFNSGRWSDENAPTSSGELQKVLAGYDRTRSIATAGPVERRAFPESHRREEVDHRQRGQILTPSPAATPASRRATVTTPEDRRPRRDPMIPQKTPGTSSSSRRGNQARRSQTQQIQTPTRAPRNHSVEPSAVAETTSEIPVGTSLPSPWSSPGSNTTKRSNLNDTPDVAPMFVRTGSPIRKVLQQYNRDDSVPEPPRVDVKDLRGSHTFKGQRQPAIGIRVKQALNWAADADVDRRMDFKREEEELKEWLKYVDEEYAHDLGENTLSKIQDLKRMIAVHELFEKVHYHDTMKTKISNSKGMKTAKQRLGDPNDQPPLQLRNFSPGAKKAKLLPERFGSHPRVWSRVNNMWDTPRDSALDFDPKLDVARPDRIRGLARDEDSYWMSTPGTELPAQNLYVRENKYYKDCKAFNGGLGGGVHWDKSSDSGTEIRRLWNGEAPGNGEGCFAAERGARRAGFEAALRQFHNTENLVATSKASLLVALPPKAKEIEAERRKANLDRGRLFDIRGLALEQLRKAEAKDDPQGFMANMAQFWLKQRALVEQARENLIAESISIGVTATPNRNASERSIFVKPPSSVWGPCIWRGVNMDNELKQDLLRQARAVKRVFDRERRVAPRALLVEMSHFFDQGYATQTDEPLYPPAVDLNSDDVQRRLRMTGQRNRDPTTNKLRSVDMIEMEWIRFILNNALSDERALEDVQPRTSLFLLFAERLERIFNDLSSPLFPDQDMSVCIKDLIDYMASMDGPIKRPKFYPYDVKYWLARLNEQGRCRYRDDWRTYGWVQRPVYKYFPEQLIVWQDRGRDDIDVEHFPEDAIYAPRFAEDLLPWIEIVSCQGSPHRLNPAVETWFHQLAFRWGRTMRNLEAVESQVWLDDTKLLPKERLYDTLGRLDAQYRALAAKQKLSLANVVRCTLDEPNTVVRSDEDVLKTICDGIIDECVRSDSMLWPGRNQDHLDTNRSAVKTRESIWDWAKPEIRGPMKQFFNLDRWPVEIQPEAIRRRIQNGGDIDQHQIWDAVTEDPTPWTYYRSRARPYQDEKVRYKEGHRKYLIGDTPRQMEVVKNQAMAPVARGKGISDMNGNPVRQRSPASYGVWSRVKSLLKRKRHDVEDGDDDILPSPKLPRIELSLIPQSIDREQLEAEAILSRPSSDVSCASAKTGGRNPNLRIHVPALADNEDDGEPLD